MKSSIAKKLSRTEVKKLILTEVPRLIKRDTEIRDFILKISSERFADRKKTEDRIEKILDELRKDREESSKRWEENSKRWEENSKRWEERWAENSKRWEENSKRWEESSKRWEERWEENSKRWEENSKRWEENSKRWEENSKRWEENSKRWEESSKRWEENQKVINSILEEIKLLHRKYDTGIGALGSRWGLRAEAAFRNSIKEILEEILPFKVERYLAMDEEGLVFGRPDQIELDLLIRDGLVIVAEIKSSISKPDVAAFLRKIQVYERKEGRKIDKKLIISPMVDSLAREFALSSGIKVYGYPEEVDIKDLQN